MIQAFNHDKPYDDFLTEQLAGDLLGADAGSPDEERARLIATGFLSLGPKVLAEGDETKMQMDIIDEQIDTLGRAVSCRAETREYDVCYEMLYDEEGRLSDFNVYQAVYDEDHLSRRSEFYYDVEPPQEVIRIFDEEDELTAVVEKEYDESDRLVVESIYNSDGDPEEQDEGHEHHIFVECFREARFQPSMYQVVFEKCAIDQSN